MAVKVCTNGRVFEETPKNLVSFGLDELYDILECNYIETIKPITFDRRVWHKNIVLDEEGKLNKKPFNFLASLICNQEIFGDILICSNLELK